MSLPKLLTALSVILFIAIGVAAFFKSGSGKVYSDKEISSIVLEAEAPLEVELDQVAQVKDPARPDEEASPPITVLLSEAAASQPSPAPKSSAELPDADRIEELFNKEGPKLPYVETIAYKSRVAWQKGRPAWLSDYAVHYKTSRHFIARSLNGKSDYLRQDVAEGDRFNVFRQDKNISFYLIVDTSRCRMWLYSIDDDHQEALLLKTYAVGLGRLDPSKASGLLTPLGKFTLGSKIATYQPKATGYHNGKKVEMMTIFGTRWIPFEKEVEGCTAPAKGFGIHGTPWVASGSDLLTEDLSSIGKYESDGCIRLATADMEELYAIIVTKPASIEIVRDFSESRLAHNQTK